MKKLIVALFLAMFLVGCGKTGFIGELPIVTNPAESGKVVVVRPSHMVGAALDFTVAINGKSVVSIGSGEHIDFAIPSGKHDITVRWVSGFIPSMKEKTVKASFEPSETVYFEISPSSLFDVDIRRTSVEEGEKLVAKTKNIGS